MSKAITGELSATLPDGTVLTDSTDLGLAWQVAEHMAGDDWKTMPLRVQHADVADFLAMFREAHAAGETS